MWQVFPLSSSNYSVSLGKTSLLPLFNPVFKVNPAFSIVNSCYLIYVSVMAC